MIPLTMLNAEQLLALQPHEVYWRLSAEEILHIFRTLDGFWAYDYEAAKRGKVGYHAELKSKRCSDGFFYSKIVLQYANLRRIIAKTLVHLLRDMGVSGPDMVAGIPDGAYELGKDVADYISVPVLELQKQDGNIKVVGGPESDVNLLLVEDFCTRGTGYTETVKQIHQVLPKVNIMPIELVIFNRGGLEYIDIDGEKYEIAAAVTHRINDWEPAQCPIHAMGSESIKPKATDENWKLITTAQK